MSWFDEEKKIGRRYIKMHFSAVTEYVCTKNSIAEQVVGRPVKWRSRRKELSIAMASKHCALVSRLRRRTRVSKLVAQERDKNSPCLLKSVTMNLVTKQPCPTTNRHSTRCSNQSNVMINRFFRVVYGMK